ncbi:MULTISPECIES: MbtH family protein [unclassified Streptomyces]|uniref:MbtH family protein n=1 Tax=unclassified Streptomyces TaxID=2593676 RepID=UPI00136AA953|nr:MULTISPECIES: MbtH family NRPS accessory protein [unclassified Streptomyces]MCW5254228.1 MbtH family NRPS accessory protein [Streptomyces sp. SHP 1-2]MYU23937.1 MbtH family NRPS accessory protein [Streptomyces sp. SID8352]
MSDETRYLVAVNDEEQHALWPEVAPLPAGWRAEGFSGTEEECAAHVDRVWPDIRPLSLRRRLAEQTAADTAGGSR